MQKIVLLNPKGGSGKTTIAINLASYFATVGLRPTLMDMDAQGSSTRWLSKRTAQQEPIHGIAGFERNTRVTRSFATRTPPDTVRLVIDTPAALQPENLPDLTRNATAILVPVLPSDIDIHAAAKCVSDLLLIAKVRRDEHRIAVIANRAKKNTLMYRSLLRFLETLRIPVVTTLRDSQSYIRVAESGTGLFEMKPNQVREDLDQWVPLVGWLAQRRPIELQAGGPALTSALNSQSGLFPARPITPLPPMAGPTSLEPVPAEPFTPATTVPAGAAAADGPSETLDS